MRTDYQLFRMLELYDHECFRMHYSSFVRRIREAILKRYLMESFLMERDRP